MIKLTILSENYVKTSFGLMAEHGFSVFVEKDQNSYLFDTGQNGICVHNSNKLGCNLKKIKKIILSHGHYDHCNGLESVLNEISNPVEIIGHSSIFDKKYLLENSSKKYIGIKLTQDYLENYLQAKFNFQDHFYEIDQGIWCTGEIPFTNQFEKIPSAFKIIEDDQIKNDSLIDDNALIIDSKKGLIIILGCAHRGLINTISYISNTLKKEPYAIIGGTHLHDASSEHFEFVKNYFKTSGIKIFAPAHCTGIDKIIDFQKEFPEITKPAFTGTVFEFK